MTYTEFKGTLLKTDYFKSLSSVIQKITFSRNNLKHIHRGYLVAKRIGFKKFEKEFNYTERNLLLIKEILDHESKRV